ncbi:MAG: hypothetical protein PVF91_04215 [Chromatiales bacterium]|jgi:hypothetical protein
MLDPLTWLVFALVYAPLHYMLPLWLAWLTGVETGRERGRLVRAIVLDCTLSLGLAITAALCLVNPAPQSAMAVLLAAVFAPYTHIWLYRRRRGTPWLEDDGS